MSFNTPRPADSGRGRIGQILSLNIRGRLIAGFAAICLVLAAAVGYTVHVVGGVAVTVDRMVSLRTPVALQSTELVSNLYSTLATLRGYLLTGNPQGKADRTAMWKELDHGRATFDEMASRFTNPENIRKWNEAKTLLDEFRAAQDKAEALAFTPDAFPATKLLVSEAVPRADLIGTELTKIIDEEATLEATPPRKLLLKNFADFRGALAMATANLRAFLLSGDEEMKRRFDARWQVVEQARAAIAPQKSLFSATQRASYETVEKTFAEFAPLPTKMFELRQSPQWNTPVHILVTEAAPRALKILDLLDGPKQADGTRSGGIKSNQKKMLTQESAEVSGGISFLQMAQWVLLAIGLAAGALITFFTARAIVTPIRAMTDAMKRLAGGDTATTVPAVGRSDEIGEMAGAVQVFKDNMIETERLRAEQAEAEKRAEAEKKAALNALADNFEASVRGVVQSVSSAATEMQSSAQSMTATAEETSRQSTAVAAASEEASTNVQTVASAAEELSSSVAEISRQVAQSTKITTKAVDEASKTNASVQGLAEAAQKIGDVVQLINDIAAQTNLLALNATIEAARAGEAGKGFAVVASEVKNLANQTAKATEEIGAQISAIQSATGAAVEAIKGIGATIGEVNQIATTIASAVEEQGAATQEIARNVQQAATGTTEVSTNITSVQQAASETGSAATQVLGAAGDLAKQSEMLRAEVDRFLAKVRAA